MTPMFFSLSDNQEDMSFLFFLVTGISCLDIKRKFTGLKLMNGIYQLQWNKSNSFDVYCDMNRDGGDVSNQVPIEKT